MKNKLKIGKFDIVDINSIKPSAVNRKKTIHHVKRFEKKIEKWGYLDTIKVDVQGNILEGHHRYWAAIELGVKKVPVYVITWANNLSKKEKIKYILAYNSGNLPWKHEDYLEKYGVFNKDYEYVYKKYEQCMIKTNKKDLISPSVISRMYLVSNATNRWNEEDFKDGKCYMKNQKFSDWLFKQLHSLALQFMDKAKTPAEQMRGLVDIIMMKQSRIYAEKLIDIYRNKIINEDADLANNKYFLVGLKQTYIQMTEELT